jgi:hypothetical protein
MKTLVIKGKDRLWPTVTWAGSDLAIQFLGSEDDDVTIMETNTLDFEEFFIHLDRGGSIFLTVKPQANQDEKPRDITSFRCSLKKIHPELAEGQMDPGLGLSTLNWEHKEMRSWM